MASAGRSLSPFRHRSPHGRSSSLSRLPSYLASTLAGGGGGGGSGSSASVAARDKKMLTAGTSASDVSDTDADTDTDSSAAERGNRMCPRNTAFRQQSGRGPQDDSDYDDLSDTGVVGGVSGETSADPSERERAQFAHRASDDQQAATDDDHTGGETTDEEHEERDVPEDDPLLDFDDATLDNTLFNAGCLDLHNAWQNNKESIGEGGWYPPDDHKAWYEDDDDDDEGGVAVDNNGAAGAPTAADYGVTQSDEPEEMDEGGGTTTKGDSSPSRVRLRTGPLDGTAPRSPQEDHSARLPNVILPSTFRPTEPKRQGSKWVFPSSSSSASGSSPHSLVASRPTFAKNRCTITLVHGEYEKAVARRGDESSRGPKKWIVASDGSAESSYAIEWTIGTVLRDGDETLIVSVMETSEKLDPSSSSSHHSSTPSPAVAENQSIRQDMATRLARQATSLLLRTRLAVKISCQALHAKHARHMLLDLIDFYEPTMVIVGSRGLGSLKNILLGSTSHYLVQKSSKPVMIARKRLQLPALPRGKKDVVSSVRRRHMRLDEAAIEKKSKVGEEEQSEEQEQPHEEEERGRQGGGTSQDGQGVAAGEGEERQSHEDDDERTPTHRQETPDDTQDTLTQKTHDLSVNDDHAETSIEGSTPEPAPAPKQAEGGVLGEEAKRLPAKQEQKEEEDEAGQSRGRSRER